MTDWKRMPPVVTIQGEGTPHESERHDHDGFAKIVMTKAQVGGRGAYLFGSEMGHSEVICIEILRASLERKHHRDHVYQKDPIVRIEMSTSQFAQFVSSQGNGTGTPVTLVRAPAPGTQCLMMPGLVPPTRPEAAFSKDFTDLARKAAEAVTKAQDRLQELLSSGKTARKKDLEEIRDMLGDAGKRLPGDMAFIRSSFQETMEHVVDKAKTEVEAFSQNLAVRVGYDALRHGYVPPVVSLATNDDAVEGTLAATPTDHK